MVTSFLKKNAKTIFYVVTWGILIYVILLRGNKIDDSYKKEIQKIGITISDIERAQKQIDSSILFFNKEIQSVEKEINEIQGQKTIIKEIYYEKINSVNTFSDKQLDSFFTERYGYYSK